MRRLHPVWQEWQDRERYVLNYGEAEARYIESRWDESVGRRSTEKRSSTDVR